MTTKTFWMETPHEILIREDRKESVPGPSKRGIIDTAKVSWYEMTI